MLHVSALVAMLLDNHDLVVMTMPPSAMVAAVVPVFCARATQVAKNVPEELEENSERPFRRVCCAARSVVPANAWTHDHRRRVCGRRLPRRPIDGSRGMGPCESTSRCTDLDCDGM